MRRPLLTLAGGLALAVVAFLAYTLLTGDDTDPRTVWATAADEACIAATGARSQIAVPEDLRDGTAVRAWAAEHAEVQRQLGADLAAIDAANDDTEKIANVAITEAKRRADIYDALAAEDSELPDPVTGEGDISEGLEASYTKVADTLEPWGSVACGTTEDRPAVASDAERWTARVEAACLDAAEEFGAADTTAADDGDVEAYLREVSSVAGGLAGELRRIGEPPAPAPAWPELLEAVDAVAVAGQRGELDAAADANAAWRAAADTLGLGACGFGVAPSIENPSNLLAIRLEIAPVSEGIAGDGAIADSGLIAERVVSSLMSGARPGHADTFGVRRLVPEVAGSAVAAGGGDTAATPTSISISEPRQLAAGDATETNPWIVGVAIADTNGACTWSQLFGVDELYGYTPPVPAAGPCTGDAAAAAYQP